MTHYKPGNLITVSIPYVFTLNSCQRSTHCEFCLQCPTESALKRCSSCKASFYCDTKCQRTAWQKFHKKECLKLKSLPSERIPTETFIYFARLVGRVYREHDCPAKEVVCNVSRSITDLESHTEEVKADTKRKEQFMILENFIRTFIPEVKIDRNELIPIFGKMVVNTYTICDPEGQAIGTGLYLGASIFDHSCNPNAVATFDGTTMYVRAIKDFYGKDHSDVRISYVDPMDSIRERQQTLKAQYYFTCQCLGCLDKDTDIMKTEVKKENHELSTQLSEFLDTSRKQQSILSPDDKMNLFNQCISKLKHSEEVLGEGHVLRIRLLDFAFDLCVDLELWKECLDFALPTMKYYKIYYGKYYPPVCIQLFKVGKVQHLIGQLTEANSTFTEAKELISICYGSDHRLSKELDILLHQCQMEMATISNHKNVPCLM